MMHCGLYGRISRSEQSAPEKSNLKGSKMTLSNRNQFASAFAAIICAFITIGMSVAPALHTTSGMIA